MDRAKPKLSKLLIHILALLIIIAIGLRIFQQQSSHPPPKRANGLSSSRLVSSDTASVTATSQPPAQIKLVHSIIVTPKGEPLTTNLDVTAAEHQPLNVWTGVQGRTDVETYLVQEGDTLWSIAAKFGLDVDTLRWSNPDLERNPDWLPLNSKLVILPVIGAYHLVVEGENLALIAALYGVAEADIINYPLNHLTEPGRPSLLKPGERLVIPNGRKDILLYAPRLDENYPLAWPVRGQITQGYHKTHLAIDIGAPYGSKVHAAKAGTVVYQAWAKTGYGFTVIIDHGDNQQTLYSHLKGALVQLDNYVDRGQVIGEVGSTGNSSGPHIHFEVHESQKQMNPLKYLKQP